MISKETRAQIDPRCMHSHAIKTRPAPAPQNRVFFNNLISLYAASNLHSHALHLFRSIPCPNTVTWTSIISAFSASPFAIDLFLSMLRHPAAALPNARTLATLLRTCGFLNCNSLAPQLQALSFKLSLSGNAFVGSAFVSLYCKIGDLESSRKVFDEMPERDEVCYGAIINGFAQNKKPIEALLYFVEMRRQDMTSSFYAISGALRAASGVAMLDQCRIIHGHSVSTGLDSDVYIATGLIDSYGKSGLVEEARRVFNELENRLNLTGWNAMMAGYAQEGNTSLVVELFGLLASHGMAPDEYTFLAVLTAFNNSGKPEEAERWLNRMKEKHGLQPRIEHYTCLVGAMGKAGRLEEAEKVALTMPYEPDSAVWRVLLSSCARSKDTTMAYKTTARLLEINPNDDSAYVILSNVFSITERWDEVRTVWKMMKDRGIRKEIGRSWIEVRGAVYTFFAGDRRHPRQGEIYGKLRELMEEIEKMGYVPIREQGLWEVDESGGRELLWCHSEKLAMAFGLLEGVTPAGKAVRIVKNLRICRDCHEVFKCVCRLVKKEIVVRDAHRYHRFLDGRCVCSDIW